MSVTLRDGFSGESLDRILEDLLVRFVINCPDEDLSSIERVFFQIEEAQWFFTDFIRHLNPKLPNLKMKGFSQAIIERCPMVWKWGDPQDELANFGKYKAQIPVRGAALLNPTLDKMLLVKGVESKTWGFPRGKISKGEEDVLCAIREVKEETGYDCTDLIDASNFAERTIFGKNYKIFIIDGVPEDTKFEPTARNEIAEIAWMDIKFLTKKVASNPGKYFLVPAMMKQILKYVDAKKGKEDVEDVKRRIASELKELLDIRPEEPSTKANIDPGRDLLEQIKAAAAAKSQQSSTTPLSAEQVQAQVQLQGQQKQTAVPPPPHHMPFPPTGFPPNIPMPFSPYAQQPPFPPFMPPNGFPMPFAPNYLFSGQAPAQQHSQPPMFGFSQFPPANGMPPQANPAPHFMAEPAPESLHKPSFSLANQRSSKADSKLLLGVLNGQIASKEDTPKGAAKSVFVNDKARTSLNEDFNNDGFGSKEKREQSKTNFLMGLFQKNGAASENAVPSATSGSIKLLKRDSSQASTNLTSEKVPTSSPAPQGTNNLLSLLRRSEQKGADEIQKDVQPEEAVDTDYSDAQEEVESEKEEADDFENFEDFEDFGEIENGNAHSSQGNLLYYEHSDDEYEYERSEEVDEEDEEDEDEDEEEEDDEEEKEEEVELEEEEQIGWSKTGNNRQDESTNPTEFVPSSQPKPKIQLLKRPAEERLSSDSNSKELLLMLKSPATSAQPERPDSSNEQASTSLLAMLKGPKAQSENHSVEKTQAPDSSSRNDLLSLLKRDPAEAPESSSVTNSDSAKLLGMLKKPNTHTSIAVEEQTSSGQPERSSSSAQLLSILKRPSQSPSPQPIENNSRQSDAASLLSMLKSPPASQKSNGSSELLSMLQQNTKREATSSPLSPTMSSSPSQAQPMQQHEQAQPAATNGRHELLNLLRRG